MTDEELQAFYERMEARYKSLPAIRAHGLTVKEVYKLYSADIISSEGRARGIVRDAHGNAYVVTGGAHLLGKHYVFGRECIPLAQRQAHHPEPTTYADRCKTDVRGESFYNGVTFKCKGAQWLILDGGEVRFASPSAAAPAPPECMEQIPVRVQLELF